MPIWLNNPPEVTARPHDLIFVPEYEIATPAKTGATSTARCCTTLRVPFGYWEAKDEKDDLDAEIEQEAAPRLPAGQHHLRGLQPRRS